MSRSRIFSTISSDVWTFLFYLCNLRSLSLWNLELFNCRIFIYFVGISWILRFFNLFKLYSYCSWTVLLKSLELKSSDPIEITNLANGNFYNKGRTIAVSSITVISTECTIVIYFPPSLRLNKRSFYRNICDVIFNHSKIICMHK